MSNQDKAQHNVPQKKLVFKQSPDVSPDNSGADEFIFEAYDENGTLVFTSVRFTSRNEMFTVVQKLFPNGDWGLDSTGIAKPLRQI